MSTARNFRDRGDGYCQHCGRIWGWHAGPQCFSASSTGMPAPVTAVAEPAYVPAARDGEADSFGVCPHGHDPADCGACCMSNAIDAYDTGLLDD